MLEGVPVHAMTGTVLTLAQRPRWSSDACDVALRFLEVSGDWDSQAARRATLPGRAQREARIEKIVKPVRMKAAQQGRSLPEPTSGPGPRDVDVEMPEPATYIEELEAENRMFRREIILLRAELATRPRPNDSDE